MGTTFLAFMNPVISGSQYDVLTSIGRGPDGRHRRMAQRARERVLAAHSHLCRAEELEHYVAEARAPRAVTG